MFVMSEEINFGFKSIAFYIGKFPALNVIDPQEIPPSEDSQGGYLFMYDRDRYFIHLNNLNEFEVIVLHENNDLAMILLPDADDLLVFFGNLVGGGKIYL